MSSSVGSIDCGIAHRVQTKLSQMLHVPRALRTEVFENNRMVVDCENDGRWIFKDGIFVYVHGYPWIYSESRRIELDFDFFMRCYNSGVFPDESDVGGQFFVIIFGIDREVLIFSDLCGSFPLFLLEIDGVLFVSSFVALLSAAAGVSFQLDAESLKALHACLRFDGSTSVYKDVKRVPTGLWYSGAGVSFRQVAAAPPIGLANLQDAIRLVLSAVSPPANDDGKVGVCLSGGLDSSLVTLLLVRSGASPELFSGVFPGLPCDEAEVIKKFVSHLQKNAGKRDIKFNAFEVNPESAEGLYESFLRGLDFPLFPMSVMECQIIKLAHLDGVRFLYDGNGGDEVFALPYSSLIEINSYRYLDVAMATLRAYWRRPTASRFKAVLRALSDRVYRKRGDLGAVVRSRFRGGGVLHPFYLAQWQFAYLHGIELIQPLRCGLLGKHLLSGAFSDIYFLGGYFRGMQRAMIENLSDGFLIDPYDKIEFSDFVSKSYRENNQERRLRQVLGDSNQEGFSWLIPRFVIQKQREGYGFNVSS